MPVFIVKGYMKLAFASLIAVLLYCERDSPITSWETGKLILNARDSLVVVIGCRTTYMFTFLETGPLQLVRLRCRKLLLDSLLLIDEVQETRMLTRFLHSRALHQG